MRYILFCTLIFLWMYSSGQGNEEDKAITNVYADTTAASPKNNHSRVSDSSTQIYLVKIGDGYVRSFKMLFKSRIKRQVNDRWFIIEAREDVLAQNRFIDKYFLANNLWKLSPTLLSRVRQATPGDSIFLVEASQTPSFETFMRRFEPEATTVSVHQRNLFRIKTSVPFVVKQIINEREVISVDVQSGAPKEESVVNDYDNSVNGVNLFFTRYPTRNGNGLTVSIKENLFDTTDIDFKNRYTKTSLQSNEMSSHATIMGTLIGGGGNSFYTGKGVAWGCNLSSCDFTVLLPERDSTYKHYDISVQNHSYGVGIENFYGSDAAAYDQSMLDDTALLHIFSAGNAGNLSDSIGPYGHIRGFANITGSFKQAKNIVTVGSVDSFYNVPLLSSKGPAYDGRIKPELVAYGNEGSSGAAALVSGTALVLQSAFAQAHHDSLPANTLIKAVLVNSADDVHSPGPDFFSGYGNLNVYRAVRDILSNNRFNGIVSQNEEKHIAISVPAHARNLKVTLAWNDPPARTYAFTALVNDLDLQLERAGDHTTWLPWVLSTAPNVDSLNQAAARKRDSLNVVEQITVDNPPADDYIIHVKGYDIAAGPQSFYVVYSYDTADRFEFISPAADDHFTSGGKSIFRWHSTYLGATGKLEYSMDKGASWQLIDPSVDLSRNYFEWVAPDTFALTLARMTIDNDVYLSDTFDMSKQLYPKVGFVCADSVLLYWNRVSGIGSYQIDRLGSKYLETYSKISDTSAILHHLTSPYLAVATVLGSNHSGINSYTFNYTTQGVSCYLSNFLADLNRNDNALLRVSLGTTYNVRSVDFEKQTPAGWKTISTTTPVINADITYVDDTLHAGINDYRAVITLADGTLIYSGTASIFYLANNIYVMMPNPLAHGQNLTIISNTTDSGSVVIYDIVGRKVSESVITDSRETVPVQHLAKGVYIVVIYRGGKKSFSGKLLVE